MSKRERLACRRDGGAPPFFCEKTRSHNLLLPSLQANKKPTSRRAQQAIRITFAASQNRIYAQQERKYRNISIKAKQKC